MAIWSGSYPKSRLKGKRGIGVPLGGAGFWLLLTATAFAAMPDFLREALDKLNPEVPAGWAYTLKTDSGGRQSIERYDPSKPPAERWTLLRANGRAATADEQAKYFKYKAGLNPGTVPGFFQKRDIEPGSVALVREDAVRAEFNCRFREQAANSDKMLGHVLLHLVVDKRHAYVQKATMVLREPYSPVLGVRMRELVAEISFAPPGVDRPSLPVLSHSHFLGRIFFVPVEENLHVTYTEFTPLP